MVAPTLGGAFVALLWGSMNTRHFSRSRSAQLLASCTVIFLAVGISSCTPKPAGPEPVAQQFLSAFGDRDIDEAAKMTDRPDCASGGVDDCRDHVGEDER
jgi:hypothetical protein